jgi:hypothetical protein
MFAKIIDALLKEQRIINLNGRLKVLNAIGSIIAERIQTVKIIDALLKLKKYLMNYMIKLLVK